MWFIRFWGDAENARPENDGQRKLWVWKMQDWKMTDKLAGTRVSVLSVLTLWPLCQTSGSAARLPSLYLAQAIAWPCGPAGACAGSAAAGRAGALPGRGLRPRPPGLRPRPA